MMMRIGSIMQELHVDTRLVSYSRAIAPIDLLDFLKSAPVTSQRILWANDREEIAFAGYGTAVEIFANGEDRFETIRREAKQLFSNAIIEGHEAGIRPRLFGGFSFQPDFTPEGIWKAFPGAYFMMPRYLLTRAGDRAWLTVNTFITPGDESDLSDELAWMINRLAHLEKPVSSEYTRTWMNNPVISYPLEKPYWHKQIVDATTRMNAGELDKVVLSRTCDVTYSDPVNPLFAHERLINKYADCYRFLIEPSPHNAFFGATPELLISVEGRSFRTSALAGSAKRGETVEQDDALATELMNNPKERHEHALVVNMLKALLQPMSDDLRIADTPDILQLNNIQHLHTPVEGTMDAHTDVLALVEALHPTPALGGFPRDVALETISCAEPISRGWYAAPVGWFDPMGNGMFAVAIRSAVSSNRTARLYAGAGIVEDSQPDREWEETKLKFRPMLEALAVQ